MHQNTRPVTIADKNGKITTVHRKDTASPSSQSAALPVPKIQTAPFTTYSFDDALSALRSLDVELSDTEYGAQNIAHLARTNEKLLSEVINAVEDADDETRGIWRYALGERPKHPQYTGDNDDHSGYYRRCIKTIPIGSLIYAEGDGDQRARRIERLASGCGSKMGWQPHQKNYTEALAAMVVVAASGNEYRFEYKGRMDDIFWIADNLEKVKPLIPVIMDRKESSRGFIESLMNNKTSSLTGGIL